MSAPPVKDPRFGDDWWQRGVIYQIYPRSFADTNGDGVGDLPGIIEHLDYLAGTPYSLGVDAIWLSPIYPSPGLDLGYDVSDYDSVDPLFGSADDFDRLVAEAHGRGIRVLLDLVMNHTSDKHAWFEESRADRTNPRAEWYLWRDPAGTTRGGKPKPPNNWVSFFGGPAWTWDPRREQFYMHTFLSQQPDLNWRNADVRDAIMTMVRGWLDRGVDGFRLDVFNAFFKDKELRSNPRRLRGRRAYDRQEHLYDKGQHELADWLAEFRAVVDEQPGRMTVGEMFAADAAAAAPLVSPRHLVFDFRYIEQPWKASAFAETADFEEEVLGPAGWPAVVLSNHDRSRPVTRFGNGAARDAIAKAAAVLLLTLRGTSFVYYGEELGLADIKVRFKDAIDPPTKWGNRLSRTLAPWWNRDGCRAPLPWSDASGAGFTTGRPWLPVPDDYRRRNVARERADPSSVLSFFRDLLSLRRELETLQLGSYRRASLDGDVLAWIRTWGGTATFIAVNFGGKPASVRLRGHPVRGSWIPRLSSVEPQPAGPMAEGATLELRPHEAVILQSAS